MDGYDERDCVVEGVGGTVEMPPSVTSATINRELPPWSVSIDGGPAGWPEFRIYKGGTEGNNISFNDVIEALKMIPQIHATVCKKDEALDAIKALIKEWIEVRLAIRKEWPAAAPTDLIANERRILTAMANWYEDNK